MDRLEPAQKEQREVDQGYQAVFKHLRKELIQSRGQVYQMLKGAGVEVPDGE